ncbi:MAG: class I SAM-dependent methyltransferase, partial [Planctomycetota bacterium]
MRWTRTVMRFESQEYSVEVSGRILRLLGPKHPHALHNDPQMRQRFEEAGYKPYWTQPWPAAVMLAEHVIRHLDPGPEPILELGTGLGIVGISLSLAGHRVLVTDCDEDALAFVRASAGLNGVRLHDVRRLDWRDPPAERFATIVAAEVIYDRQNHQPIASLIAACLKAGGSAFVSDTNRETAKEFPDALRAAGLTYETAATQAKAIPSFDSVDGRVFRGTVYRIFRSGS